GLRVRRGGLGRGRGDGRALLALFGLRGLFRFRRLGSRRCSGGSSSLGALLVLLLLRALVEVLWHALFESRHAVGENRLALARQLLLGVEEIQQIGRIETAKAAGAAAKRARNRHQDTGCDKTLRKAH